VADDQQRTDEVPSGSVRSVGSVGSVAEEAARLLDALGGWAERSGYAARAGAPVEDVHPHPAEDTAEDPADVPADVPDDRRDLGGEDGATGAGAEPACPQCGAAQGVGRAASCRVCPLCQGVALLRSVRPETVDRLADLASAVAATLRDVAGERRGREPAPPPGPPRASRVQDIPIDDEDSQGARA
jgi:hypothetical protein